MPPTIRNPATRRKRYFPHGQYDPVSAPDITPAELDYAQAAIKCQQLNNMTGPTHSQQHAVMISIGYRLIAERQPLPKF